MARLLLLGALVQRCRQRANREGDDQLDVTEWKALISEYYGEMHALIVDKGARYFEAEQTIATTGLSTYALPSDHMATVDVALVLDVSSGRRRSLIGPVDGDERARFMGESGTATRYGFEGSSLALYPVPTSETYKHLYVPQPTDYSTSSDATSIDLINIYGEKFVIWGVASVAQHKGSESQERAMAEHQRAAEQLEYWAGKRALNPRFDGVVGGPV